MRRCFGGSGDGRGPCGLRFVRQQIIEFVLWVCADALEDVAQVFERVDARAFAGRRDAPQDCSRPAAVVAAERGPVPPSHCDSTQATLGAGMPTSGLCRATRPPRKSAILPMILFISNPPLSVNGSLPARKFKLKDGSLSCRSSTVWAYVPPRHSAGDLNSSRRIR